MKFNLNNGNVTLTSETKEEALRLFAIATEEKTVKQHVQKDKTRCHICGKGFINLKALGVHRAKTHGIKVKNSDKNHQYYLKWKQKQAVEKAKGEMQSIWK